MNSGIFIGVDLGTSGCRAYAIDASKNILATANAPLPTSFIINKHVAQKPNDWWQICQNVLEQLLHSINRDQVKAISIDGTSGSVLLCEKNGTPLSDGYMYNDSACQTEAKQIREIAPDESGAHGASSGLAKCLYLNNLYLNNQLNREDVVCLNQADWIAGKLLDRFDTSDENNALKLGYDPVKREWPKWLDQLNCRSILPSTVLQPGDISGEIDPNIADQFNLPHSTKIVAGTTDSIAAFIATGCHNIGEAVTSLGSTLAIKLISDKPVFSPEYGVYSHRLGEKWLVGGASNSGGAVIKKYFSVEKIEELSQKINPEKSSTFNYYPLLTPGERFPINDPLKQPTLSPRPEDDVLFLQGVLEGISTIEKMAFDKLTELGAPYPTRIITMGGGSRNEAWRCIREMKCGVKTLSADITEAAFGVALLALKGVDER